MQHDRNQKEGRPIKTVNLIPQTIRYVNKATLRHEVIYITTQNELIIPFDKFNIIDVIVAISHLKLRL